MHTFPLAANVRKIFKWNTAYLEYLHQLYTYNFSGRELEKDFVQETCKINDA